MPRPATMGKECKRVEDMNIGDYIKCTYIAPTANVAGEFYALGEQGNVCPERRIHANLTGVQIVGCYDAPIGNARACHVPVDSWCHENYVSEISFSKDWTVEGWFKLVSGQYLFPLCPPEANSAANQFRMGFTGYLNSTDNTRHYWLSSNGTSWNILSNGVGFPQNNDDCALGKWFHWSIGMEGNTFFAHVNGKLDFVMGLADHIKTTTGCTLNLGQFANNYNERYMKEFRITIGQCRHTEDDFTPSTVPEEPDEYTKMLYHFDIDLVNSVRKVSLTELPTIPGTTPCGYFYFIKAEEGMLIADRMVQSQISWQSLNAHGYIYGGKTVISDEYQW